MELKGLGTAGHVEDPRESLSIEEVRGYIASVPATAYDDYVLIGWHRIGFNVQKKLGASGLDPAQGLARSRWIGAAICDIMKSRGLRHVYACRKLHSHTAGGRYKGPPTACDGQL